MDNVAVHESIYLAVADVLRKADQGLVQLNEGHVTVKYVEDWSEVKFTIRFTQRVEVVDSARIALAGRPT